MPMYGNESTSAAKPVFEMDKEAEDRFCRFVERMPPRPDGMIRLFDRGDYFSAHGADALLVANEVYKTTNVIKYLGQPQRSGPSSSTISSRGLPSVTISMTLTKAFLRECLTTKQMRVEIYEPEEGTAGRKNNTRWTLSKTASPGNISQLEDLLFSHTDLVANAVSMALKVQVREGGRIVGAAFVDVQEKLIGVAEYIEDEMFGNTESLLIQLGVKECLLQADDKRADHELAKLRTLVERCGVIVTERRSADFMTKNVEQDLNRLLDETHSGVALPEFDLKNAMSAASALLVYLSLLSDISLHGQFRLHHHDLSQYMKLDASALKALNLMPNPNELGGNKNMSLYGLLNRCKTSQGQRLLGRWLKQPLINLHEIKRRQDVVEALADDRITRDAIRDDNLKFFPDFHRISKRFHRSVASLEDVVRVYQAIGKLAKLIDLLSGINPSNPEAGALIDEIYITPLRQNHEKLFTYEQMVEDTIDLDELSSHNYVLKAELDEDLRLAREDIVRIRDQLDAEHRRVGDDLGVDIEKKLHLENHQVYKYSFRITKAEAGLIRNKKQYIDLATQKSGSIFTTRHLKELNDEYTRVQEDYDKKQKKLVAEIVTIAATYTPIMEVLDNLIAGIDVTASFAHVSMNAPAGGYVKPKMSEKGAGDVVVKGARHPCLEVQEDIVFIPNDHEMRKGSSEFLIITGPNMGGKSTYIRQIGVIALMAQVGCFVPAEEAELPIFDCILARVGAGDSQLKGVSTFMAEMLETATILRAATKDSLIIIDELGRGTSTYDGFGLAWAISEHIATRIRPFCLFATHFHELTSLEKSLDWVNNLHVVADTRQRSEGGKQERDITLLYKVEPGVCDESFGIHVAELANFPESVVKLAKRKAEELEDFGDGTTDESLSKVPKLDTEEGTALIKSFLDTWKERVESQPDTMSEEEQVAELRRTADEFKERFEGNEWVKSLMEAF
ncbi:muts domain V-domain-containing protein [Naematelia encephala]|uniref:Muts domain V-domain-containing protein n=1 Tax=Naematelia encephala TaxID=71784 RepID=A0A1Y2B461_9TREE|nr:muts domain V-domain-containing protein [Naematelia encephala]